MSKMVLLGRVSGACRISLRELNFLVQMLVEISIEHRTVESRRRARGTNLGLGTSSARMFI